MDERKKSDELIIKLQKKWLMIAASLILLLGISYILIFKIGRSNIEVTTTDQIDIFYLPDSSLIYLNKNSSLVYPEKFLKNERTIYLKGEAFFEIRKDSARQFKIFADSSLTTVLGTSFNIKAYEKDEQVEVIVATGKVYLSPIRDTTSIQLKPNEKGTLNKKDLSVSKEKNLNKNYIGWKERLEEIKKTALYKNEAQNPAQFLLNESTWRQNLVKQTIIEGEINSKAALVAYSNLKLKVVYYTSGGAVLKTDFFRIDMVVKPGKAIVYTYKLNDWFTHTTKVIVEIEDADIAE
jgi:hypothetical protein